MPVVIAGVVALWLVQLFLQETTLYRFDLFAIIGNRDHRPEPSVVAARLGRAKDNLLESLPVFLGLAVLCVALGVDGGLALVGAWTFLVARVLFVPAYASGVLLVRSLIWLCSIAGLLMMAAGALGLG